MAARCNVAGFCARCHQDGERIPNAEAMSKAFYPAHPDPREAARIVLAAHLHFPVADDMDLLATPFARLRLAQSLEGIDGRPIEDAAILAVRTVADVLALFSPAPAERAAA